ncbi:MAG TPA: hypothetical protein PKE51_01060 [Gemmatimonadaceae bacterium]|nr:hypothetical protein [Gemmatimonadaceae bacterium]
MHRKLLCGLALCGACTVVTAALSGQPVPARDLWEFPLGAVGEPAALATEAGVGLWNPATVALPAGVRWQTGVASLSTGADQAVEGQLIGAAFRRPGGWTIGVSVARAAVGGLVRTETDPQSLGTIAYESMLGSLTMARDVLPWLQVGAAARYRYGRVEQESRTALAADVGFIARAARYRDIRVAGGTFLWRPGRESEDRPVVTLAIDARLLGRDPRAEWRVGVAGQAATRGQQARTTGELGPFMSARVGPLEARAAVPRVRGIDERLTRVRFSLGLHLSRVIVGIAREDANVGLGPLYQFTFSAFGT